MDLNLTKLLNSCKSEKLFTTIKQHKHWLSSKTFKSNQISLSTHKSQIISKDVSRTPLNLIKKLDAPLYHVKCLSIPDEQLNVSSSKLMLARKQRVMRTPVKIANLNTQEGKVCHTYALPKKLRSVKKEHIDFARVNESHKYEKKVILSKNLSMSKPNIFQVKDFPSKNLLRRNEFYKESYLKDLADKYDEYKN